MIEFFTGRRPPTASQRRFAVVMYTDIVGSTARANVVGDAQWTQLLEEHGHIAHRTVGPHGGRVVRSTGDGILAVFDSPSSAVEAAQALRPQLDEIGLAIRTGLHAGEVEVHADGDISGVGANLAARVEQHASDGAIYVSATMQGLLLGTSFAVTDRGTHTLKGFDGTWQQVN